MTRRRIVVGDKPAAKPSAAPPPEPVERPSTELPPEREADWASPRIAELARQLRSDRAADPPREVLADVLAQAGASSRAELIHLQVQRARLPAWDDKLVEIELRERVLLAAHAPRWRADLPALEGVTWGPFTRGFVGTAMFDSFSRFIRHADECFEAAPLHGIALPWPRSSDRVHLEPIPGLRELTIFGTVMTRQDLEWLAGSPLLSTLRSLTLLDSELDNIAPIVRSPHLANLETLSLPMTRVDDDSLYRLIQASPPRLSTLELSKADPIEDYGGSRPRRSTRSKGPSYAATALAGWPGFARLHTLDLTGTKLGSEGLAILLGSPHSRGLKTLVVRDIVARRKDDPLAAFATGPAGSLDVLDVSDNDLDAHGASCLAEARSLQGLKVLRIERVVSSHFARLAKAAWFDQLRVLACGQTALLPIVKRAPHHLHTLRVVAERSSSKDLIQDLAAGPLPLTRLDLSEARLTDADLTLLGTLATLPRLAELRLASGRRSFTREVVQAFLRSPLGARLVSVDTGFDDLDVLPPPTPIAVGRGGYAGPRRYLST